MGQVAEGEPCIIDSACQSGFCDYSLLNECYGQCAPVTALAQEGEACGMVGCADGLACVYDSETFEQKCVAKNSRAEGESCEFQYDLCEEELVCGVDWTCVQSITYAAAGTSCAVGTPCEAGSTCLDRTCAPHSAEGEPCSRRFSARAACGVIPKEPAIVKRGSSRESHVKPRANVPMV